MSTIMCDDTTTNLLEYLTIKAMMRDLPGMPDRYQTCNSGDPHLYEVVGSGHTDEFQYIMFSCKWCGFGFKDPIPTTLTTKE